MPGVNAPRPFNHYGAFLKKRFGCTIRKITVDAGFTCPNRDGTSGTGGCIYCVNESFNPNQRQERGSVGDQVRLGISLVSRRYPDAKFLVYFQAFTNTYAPLQVLKDLYRQPLEIENVIGLSIGTRPDCVDDDVLDLIQELSKKTYIQLELGLQSANDKTLKRINRGHNVAAYTDAMKRCRERNIEVCTHMIVGLPGEGHDDALATARLIADSGASGIKIHNLHIIKDSALAKEYEDGNIEPPPFDNYVSTVCDILEILPSEMTVQRLYGNAPSDILLAPEWCLDGNKVICAIDKELSERNTRQGSKADNPGML